MKTKYKILLSAAVVVLIGGVLCFKTGILNNFSKDSQSVPVSSENDDKQKEAEENEEEGKKVADSPYNLAFGVWGDIQDNASSLQNAIDDIENTEIPLNALMLNGDIVDQGIDSQYETISSVLEDNKKALPERKNILMSIGNHEFFDYSNANKNADDVNARIQKFLNFAQRDKVYYDQWINGYHFIVLGGEDGNSPTANQMLAYISDEQMNWLKEKLNEGREDGKPVFVFLHQPIYSRNSWNRPETNRSDELRNLLLQYPEVYLFTSHIHRQLEESCISFDGVKTAETGSVDYTLFLDNGEVRDHDLSYGLYVTVNGNDVTIKGRDFVKKEWMFEKKSSS